MNKTPDEELAELLTSGSQLQPSKLNARLRAVWPLLHAPQRKHDGATLVDLFRQAGYVSDGMAATDSALTVYRGELVAEAEPGISWSAEFQIARSYAQRYSTVGHTRVLQATAPPTAVLARFNQEAEVVVEPELLDDIKNLGYIHHFKLPMLGHLG